MVDAYNLVSLRSLCSLGAHDLDTLTPPVSLTVAVARMGFVPLGQMQFESIGTGEFVFLDSRGRVICRLDVRQAEFSKVTDATRRVLMIIAGTTAHDTTSLTQAFEEAARLMADYCEGITEIVVLP